MSTAIATTNNKVICTQYVVRCPVNHCGVLMLDSEDRAVDRMTDHIMKRHNRWALNRARPASPPVSPRMLPSGYPAREHRQDGYERSENCAAYALRILVGEARSTINRFMESVSDIPNRGHSRDVGISSRRFLSVLNMLGFRIEEFAYYDDGYGNIGTCDEFGRRPDGNFRIPTFGTLRQKRDLQKAICLGFRHAWPVIDGEPIDEHNVYKKRVRAVAYMENDFCALPITMSSQLQFASDL